MPSKDQPPTKKQKRLPLKPPARARTQSVSRSSGSRTPLATRNVVRAASLYLTPAETVRKRSIPNVAGSRSVRVPAPKFQAGKYDCR
ncbi:hypothetical protein FRC12_018272 [Ceratobasidium sp. 428]|nr:hypothetical protein FRC12_018272 [Ceratobasidium sp. 428]